MKSAPIPNNEKARLDDLYAYDILDTEAEQDFEELVDLVTELCDCPMASITFIDKDRQWFKAQRNMMMQEGKRDESFCGHTILQEDVMVVNDATLDERFCDSPLVTSGIRVGFYAGATITSSSGFALGAVCAIDNKPRQLTTEQINAIRIIARQVSRLLELRMKNQQIVQASKRLVEAEKTIARLNLVNRENENFKTAYSLHEEVAQTIAAVRLYINMAIDSPGMENQFLQAATEELDKSHRLTTSLSHSITPTTFKNDQYEAHIEKLIDDQRKKNGARIQYRKKGNLELLHSNFGLMVFRILQDLFRMAGKDPDLSLYLGVETDLVIHFEYTDPDPSISQDRVMLESNISHRIDMLGGEMKLESNDAESLTGIFIHIPLPVPAA